jgi:hypothetical protein
MMKAATLLAAAALAAGVEEPDFQYVRELRAPQGGPILFQADGALFAHTRATFADLRIVDARGTQVPWRLPPEPATGPETIELLNSGRQGDRAVALLDLGAERRVIDRMELDIPGEGFVGRVTVFGGDRRQGAFTRLGTTAVYDVAGAEGRARSTTVVFRSTDFRFLRLEATGVSAIAGAIVSARPRERRPEAVPARVTTVELQGRTRVVLDLSFRRRPVDELSVAATTERYDRELLVEASNDGRTWRDVAFGRVVHFPGSVDAPLALGARGRYLRLTIFNGDDAPLAGIEATALARPRLLLAEEGHSRPYRLLYGSPTARAPRYDFARLPAPALRPASFVGGTLGPERRNPVFEPPADDRPFFDRHPWLVQAALALVAVALAAAGFLVLRRKT